MSANEAMDLVEYISGSS